MMSFGSDLFFRAFRALPWTLPRSLNLRWETVGRTLSGRRTVSEDRANSVRSTTITPLAQALYSQTLYTGPVTVSDFMQQCLTHPTHGYYTTRKNIFGGGGDFITAPDVTPVFSELLAVCIANYLRQNASAGASSLQRVALRPGSNSVPPFRLVEFGPGNGSMLKTLLPTLSRLKCTPSSLLLVDASAQLRQKQREVLDAIEKNSVPDVTWYSNVSEAIDNLEDFTNVDGGACLTVIIAHEFLDALPVHVFQRVASVDTQLPLARQWTERLIDVDSSASSDNAKCGSLRFVLSPRVTPASALLSNAAPLADETVIELCPQAQSLVRNFGHVIERHGGLALIIDYGNMKRRGETVRALGQHAPADLLARPGEHDVTADVDFGTLRRVIEQDDKASFIGTVSQRKFLLRLGAANRFRVLARNVINKGGDELVIDQKLKRLQQDYQRITGVGDDAMGEVYNVAAICPKGATGLAGFEDVIEKEQVNN